MKNLCNDKFIQWDIVRILSVLQRETKIGCAHVHAEIIFLIGINSNLIMTRARLELKEEGLRR